jgi:hypothetical protein
MNKKDKILVYSKWGIIYSIDGIPIIFRTWKKGWNYGIYKWLFS